MPSPNDYIYKYLTRLSGPQAASGNDFDVNTDSALEDTIFNYVVPVGRVFRLSRIDFVLVDNSIRPGNFGGIGNGLANGCLLEIVNSELGMRLNFDTDKVPLKTNADFAALAGVDIPITQLPAGDLLPIRFSFHKAGGEIDMKAGCEIRWTNRDNLSSITKFRAMIQGVLK